MQPFGPSSQQDDLGLADPIYARICQRIRSDILSGELAPGQRLKISDLIKRYKVSQMPIREALQQLQGEWLVTISPNRGACVRQVDAAFIGHMYEIRGVIEGLLARRCAESAGEEDIAALSALEAECEAHAAREDLPATLAANKEFHGKIYQIAGNPVATELLNRHFGLLQALRKIYGVGPRRFERLVEQHRHLMDAIRRHDAATAAEAGALHCESARDDLLARLDSHREADVPSR